MKIDKIYKTDFIKQTNKDIVGITKFLMKNRNKKLTIQEEYIRTVSKSVLEITKMLENLEYCEIFLNSYTVSTTWNKKYDRSHYIRYHYEMWIMNLIRLNERLYILVNDVYDLGIGHKEASSHNSIATNKHLEGTETLVLLKKIHNALNGVQSLKNQIFHRSMYDDDKLGEIDMFDFVARHTKNSKEKLQFLFASKLKARFYLYDKKKEVKVNNQAMTDIVEALFNSLNTTYTLIKNRYE